MSICYIGESRAKFVDVSIKVHSASLYLPVATLGVHTSVISYDRADGLASLSLSLSRSLSL